MKSNTPNEDYRQRRLYRRRLFGIILQVILFITAMTFIIVGTIIDDFDTSLSFFSTGGTLMGAVFLSFIITIIVRATNPGKFLNSRSVTRQMDRASKRMEKFSDAMFGSKEYQENGSRKYDAATAPYPITSVPESKDDSKYYCGYCGYNSDEKVDACPDCGKRN